MRRDRPGLAGALGVGIILLLTLFGGCRRPIPPANDGAVPRAVSTPALTGVRPEVGFATRQTFLDHFDKHGREFGDINRDDYLRLAQKLRDAPVGGPILEVVRRDGVITRYDRVSGAFLAFNADRTIRTFFKPNDGENYFRRQGKR